MVAVAWTAIALLGATLIAFIALTHQSIGGLSAKIDELGTSLNARIDELGTSLNARIDALNQHLSARIDALAARIDAHLERHRSA